MIILIIILLFILRRYYIFLFSNFLTMQSTTSVRGRDFNDMLVFNVNEKQMYVSYDQLNSALRTGPIKIDNEEIKQQYDELVSLGCTLGARIVYQEGDNTKILFYQRQHYYLITVEFNQYKVELYR